MTTKILALIYALLTSTLFTQNAAGQGIQPYPNAITDRSIRQETPMPPPATNVPFRDRDFGSLMVRVTDPSTNFKLPGTFVRTEASGKSNEWSVDNRKFYVVGKGGQAFAFGFSPSTMTFHSLPNAAPGKGLLLPLRIGPTFSFVDSDLIYGTRSADPLTITSYRFSTNSLSTVVDTRTCGVQPPLGSGPGVVSDDDVSLSLTDGRVSISEGGPESGAHMFMIVYDKKLGCRWYNTQTGQMGGTWGAKGYASVTTPFLIRHAYLSKSGKYAYIMQNFFGWYVWDLSTLNVTPCEIRTGKDCGGYSVPGYNTYVNDPESLDDMQILKRPFSDITNIIELNNPLPTPANREQEPHFTWSNVNIHDSTPVCGSNYNYDGDTTINQPYAGEIYCVETDGLASTIWRFAHHRAVWVDPYFQTQPLGSVSRNGRFFLFTSTWDGQLGPSIDGTPDSAVFIVKLD